MRFTHLPRAHATLAAAATLLTPAAALACGNAMGKPDPVFSIIAIAAVVGFLWLVAMVILLIASRIGKFSARKPALVLCALSLLGGVVWFVAEQMTVRPIKAYHLHSITRRLPDGAKSYFTAEQKFGPAEPWHAVKAGDDTRQAGMPVPWAEYTFPGGVNYAFSSAKGPNTPPRCSDAPVQRSAFSSDHPNRYFDLFKHEKTEPLTFATFAKLNYHLDAEEEARLLIGYETGPGRGAKATATITVMVNFKPETPECHTEKIFLTVDPESQEVKISEVLREHELE